MGVDVALSIRPITLRDLRGVARVHVVAFPESALTALGMESARRYYEWQLTGPHDVAALGVVQDGKMAAFCFGGVFRGALSGFLRKNRNYLAWRVTTRPWLLASPLFRERLAFGLRTLTVRRRKRRFPPAVEQAGHTSSKPAFSILAIAVHPACARMGFGRSLMDLMEDEARKRGFAMMRLTVSPENNGAVNFYERLGWSREPHGASWRGAMSKTLTLDGAPGSD
jgi:ribosomal protein S18 acetylase RimI-like enzyme